MPAKAAPEAVTAAPKVSNAQQTFDAVQALVSDKQLSKSDAIKLVAKDPGRSAAEPINENETVMFRV